MSIVFLGFHLVANTGLVSRVPADNNPKCLVSRAVSTG